MDTLLLTAEDVHQVVQRVGIDVFMDRLTARLREVILNFNPEQTEIPARSGFSYDVPREGLVEWMPCHQIGDRAVVKMVGYHPLNGQTNGLPTVISTVSAYDTASGHLQTLADATLLTALRTGAASAVATDVLAIEEVETVGLLGLGAQAVTQLHALTRIRPIRHVLMYDSDPSAVESFEDRVAAFGADLTYTHASPEAVAEGCDVLCTATSVGVREGPVFQTDDLRPWCHVNAVGSDFPGKTELPLALLREALVCPDFPAQALVEGECQSLAPEAVGPSLAEIVASPDAYASARQRLTVFDSTGWALEDDVALHLLVELAEPMGLGTRIEIEDIGGDALNPYGFLPVHSPLAVAAS